MRGGYQIIDLSSVEIGNETIVDNIYNTIKNYDEKPVFIITPNNSGVFAEFSNNNNMYIGAYIGSNGHLFTVSIISSNSVTITDKGQAGGSGTSNYNELSNKPAIAGTTLSGDKSLSDFGIQGALIAGSNISIDANNEISANVDSIAASSVTYNNTSSGMIANNVQEAITELNRNMLHFDYYGVQVDNIAANTWVTQAISKQHNGKAILADFGGNVDTTAVTCFIDNSNNNVRFRSTIAQSVVIAHIVELY